MLSPLPRIRDYGTPFRMDDPGVCPGVAVQTGIRPCGTEC
uniref:Uncharacterized protein n=1 Tax=Siphoviridae sp. ctjel6 TaxID=2826440 RepID=A0A8S5N6W1_9CAUD|nr:MAG TPA: hypothetical protein [Siphoviridae sp. ctjel6]